MMTIDTTEMKNAIRTSTAFQESGIKRITVAGFKIYDESEDCVRYQVAIRHKVLENGDNASVYEVAKYDDGKMHAYYNGTFRVSKDGVLESCWDVHYGSFTNEMAREWLSNLFNGDDEEVAQEMEAEVAETSTEAPAESEETPVESGETEVSEYMQGEIAHNLSRVLEAQQKVVYALGTFDEGYESIRDTQASYRFDGMPEEIDKMVRDYRARMCDLHNQMHRLQDEMRREASRVAEGYGIDPSNL